MSFDLTNKNIQDTFQNLLQKTGSDGRLFDLEGNQVNDLTLTNVSASGHISASKFVGDGSQLTGLSSAAISSYTNNGNNRVVTSVDANTVNGEANLTFDDSTKRLGVGTNVASYSLDIGGYASSTSNTIRMVQGNDGTAIRIGAGGGSHNVTLLRVDGASQAAGHFGISDDSQYGFSLKYMGVRSANKNSLSIFSDNQTGTAIEAFTMLQDGKIGIGNPNTTEKLTVEGNISASGDIFAHSGSFNYITASIIDVDADTIRFGGEPFTKANIQALKLGRSLKPLKIGRSFPDVEGDDGIFAGNITGSRNLIINGNVDFNKDLDVDGITNLDNTFIDGNLIVDTNTLRVNSVSNRVGISVNTPSEKLEVGGGNVKITSGDLNASAGAVSASKINVTTNDTNDFFLLKSGSLDSLKVNGQGVLVLGGFTFEPTAIKGGLYYNDTEDEFYAGKQN